MINGKLKKISIVLFPHQGSMEYESPMYRHGYLDDNFVEQFDWTLNRRNILRKRIFNELRLYSKKFSIHCSVSVGCSDEIIISFHEKKNRSINQRMIDTLRCVARKNGYTVKEFHFYKNKYKSHHLKIYDTEEHRVQFKRFFFDANFYRENQRVVTSPFYHGVYYVGEHDNPIHYQGQYLQLKSTNILNPFFTDTWKRPVNTG